MPEPGLIELLLIAVQVLVVVAIIVAIGRLIMRVLRRPDPALDTSDLARLGPWPLRDRFASGDIDEAEYERLRSALQRG